MGQITTYALQMEMDSERQFWADAGSDFFLEANFSDGRESVPIWVGFRGQSSRYLAKPSLEIWFAHPYQGFRRLHLNAAYYDPSLIRAKLCLDLFADLGVPTPNSWHVWVTLNGEPLGLYLAVESFDQHWAGHQGASPAAIYYAVGSQGNFGLLHPDTRRQKRWLAAGYEKCYPWDDDTTDLEALISQICLLEPEEFDERIASVVDVEGFLRWLIGVEFMGHTDGLLQNYAIFRSTDGLWRISPWDCDATFGRSPSGEVLPADFLPVGTGDGNYLVGRLVTSRTCRPRYLDLWHELLGGCLHTDRVVQRVETLTEHVRRHAVRDRQKGFGTKAFRRESQWIARFARERTVIVQGYLARQAVG